MSPEEKYLYDLRGYLVLEQALAPELVDRLNQTVDELESLGDEAETTRGAKRPYVRPDNVYAQMGSGGGLSDYYCNVLSYGDVFEELIDLPTTLPYVEEMIGVPCRLDAASFMSRTRAGAFRFHHGGAELLPYSEYAVEDGHFQCVSVKISFALTDVGVEDGCLAVIPGSHKSNFANPLVGQVPDPAHPLVENRGQRVRRTLFYSYAPAFHCRWRDLADPAAGLAARGNERRVELVEGPAPFQG